MQRRKKLIKKTKMKFRNSQDTLLKMLTTTTTNVMKKFKYNDHT